MSDQYVGEIRMFGGPYAPAGWLMCWGQTVAISEYQTLFALLGITYGGNGTTTFGLPDLRGRVAMGQGNGAGLTPCVIGQQMGCETVSLQANESSHGHALLASANAAGTSDPLSRVLGQSAGVELLYRTDAAASVALHESSVGKIGQSHAHNNMMPSLGVNFIIACDGEFPIRD